MIIMEKLKIFAKTIEDEALSQIEAMANSTAYRDCTIRVMPDCHAGKGCTVGTVIETRRAIIPNTVGVDIGCGMYVCELGNVDIDLERLDNVINTHIPSGFSSHNTPIINFQNINYLCCKDTIDIHKAQCQIGTLGGGNHFIEVNVDSNGNKYLVIHSGSRNLGKKVCEYYQNEAHKACNILDVKNVRESVIRFLKSKGCESEIQHALSTITYNTTPKDLCYLWGRKMSNYLCDMQIAQSYASINRATIARVICTKMGWDIKSCFETIHNYIEPYTNILRKGAVSAKLGEKLIIPINMRDGSLICSGKGNIDWLCSAPHGAGRLMSRKKAKENLTMDEYKKQMCDVYSTSICEDTLDEAPMAYKPIDEIIECIKPTVAILEQIKPIYNFKAK